MSSTPPIPLPQIHTHHSPRNLIPLLQRYLPYSGPVLRRIQHNLIHPSKTAKCLATLAPAQSLPDSEPRDLPWLVAYVDVYAGRETQVWIFSNAEVLTASRRGASDRVSTFFDAPLPTEVIEKIRAQLLALMAYIRTALLPGYLSMVQNEKSTESILTNGNVEGTPRLAAHPPTSLLVGSLHSALLQLLAIPSSFGSSPSSQTEYPRVHLHRTHHPNVKYVFSRSEYAQKPDENLNAVLPPGYRFHDRQGRHGLQPHQVPLIQDRTYIFRSKELLMSSASAVVYYDDPDADQDEGDGEENPVSWVFLGQDGSLVTLHVEPEHRGKGLAVQVGREVMRRGMSLESELFELVDSPPEQGWVFADVLADNVASRRVMEKMGGEATWTVAWAVVEVCVDGECSFCARVAGGS